LLGEVWREQAGGRDLVTYFDVRVGGQYAEYYRPRVRKIERRLGWFRAVGFVLGAIGAVLGRAAVLLATSFAAWIAVVSTVATAVAVHVSATRYEFQRIEFARTAEELRRIKTLAEQPGVAEQELHRLARRAERVISIENQGWMAKLAEDPADQKAPG
jgi:SMODS and SLOG-associating 2TM effector domain 1